MSRCYTPIVVLLLVPLAGLFAAELQVASGNDNKNPGLQDMPLSPIPRADDPSANAFPGKLMYYKECSGNTFGQWVMREPGSGRLLMFFSCNSAIKNGKLVRRGPGDPGTHNPVAPTWHADRIYVTWGSSDGKTGWDAESGPMLLLSPGGTNENCLIGDPTVAYWQGQWHMYYEGTSSDQGATNFLFHATAEHWKGPWTKQGQVQGVMGHRGRCGWSWPTVLIDAGQLILYYTDGKIRLMAAVNSDATGHTFRMANFDAGQPVNDDPRKGPVNPRPVIRGFKVNRGAVKFFDGAYHLVHDNLGRTNVFLRVSADKFDFTDSPAKVLMAVNEKAWYDKHVGLPSFFAGEGCNRIYFTGATSNAVWSYGQGKIGYYEAPQ